MPRAYPAEFRARAVALVRAGKEQKQTAVGLGMHPVTLSKWLRQDAPARVPGRLRKGVKLRTPPCLGAGRCGGGAAAFDELGERQSHIAGHAAVEEGGQFLGRGPAEGHRVAGQRGQPWLDQAAHSRVLPGDDGDVVGHVAAQADSRPQPAAAITSLS